MANVVSIDHGGPAGLHVNGATFLLTPPPDSQSCNGTAILTLDQLATVGSEVVRESVRLLLLLLRVLVDKDGLHAVLIKTLKIAETPLLLLFLILLALRAALRARVMRAYHVLVLALVLIGHGGAINLASAVD